MKKRFLLLLFASVILLSLGACGNRKNSEKSISSDPTKLEVIEPQNEKAIEEVPDVHDSDLESAKESEKGSIETLSGKYAIDGTKNQFYVFQKNKAYILKEGHYRLGEIGKITISNSIEETEYKVSGGGKQGAYNLLSGGTLLPLRFYEGYDGVYGEELFSGVYTVNHNKKWKYIFDKEGNVFEIQRIKCQCNNGYLSLGNDDYSYHEKNGTIILQSNGTDMLRLIPSN